MSKTPPTAAQAAARDVHEVRFVAYPKLMFVWPLILMGLLLWPFAAPDASADRLETLAWVYVFTLALVLMTLGVDVDRNQAAFWVVLVFAIWILGKWLKETRGLDFFAWPYLWFDRLDIRYDRNLGLGVSVIMAIPFAVMMGWARFNDSWRITHNEFEHYSFGRMDDSLGRGAKTIRTEFPCVFELLLGGAGTMIVYNATGTQELRRIPHVLFLPTVRKRLNKILEATSVVNAERALTEEEDG